MRKPFHGRGNLLEASHNALNSRSDSESSKEQCDVNPGDSHLLLVGGGRALGRPSGDFTDRIVKLLGVNRVKDDDLEAIIH